MRNMTSKLSTLAWMVAIAALLFGLYMVKYKVQAVRQEVADTEEQLLATQEALHVARAEWTYLTRPERLARLAGRHLKLEPMTAAQITELDAVPYPEMMTAEEGQAMPPAAAAQPTAPAAAQNETHLVPASYVPSEDGEGLEAGE